MLIRGTLEDSDHAEYQQLRNNWSSVERVRTNYSNFLRKEIKKDERNRKDLINKEKKDTKMKRISVSNRYFTFLTVNLNQYQGRSLIEELFDIMLGHPVGYFIILTVAVFFLCMKGLSDEEEIESQKNKKKTK